MRNIVRDFLRRAGERVNVMMPLSGQDYRGRATTLRIDNERLRLHEALDITASVTGQLASVSSSAAQALPLGTRFVRVLATHDLYLRLGTGTPVAADGDGLSMYLPAGLVEYLLCPDPTLVYSLAVIRESEDGVLHWATVL
jgi:hypothetical protein